MVYANPNGHDWSNNYNWDGLGISYVAFGVAYSILVFAMCAIAWAHRQHRVIKMRNIGLAIASIMVLHVCLFMIFLAYVLNGHYPCGAEFWFMSFYLPMGVGLFQAQNQQLLLVSRVQSKLIFMDDVFRPLPPARFGPKRWAFKLKQSWAQWTEGSKYLGLVVVGIIVQFIASTVIFFLSRKFTSIGIVSEHVSKGLCRRGWEWAPSIVWQFLWNWIFGPLLLWKIRMIRDIYHWRLQTTLCILAGLPGSPMWLLSTYHEGFAPMNKYWIPAAWFVPGLMTMQLVTLGFPIYQVYRHKRAARSINREITYWHTHQGFTFTMGSIISKARRARRARKATLTGDGRSARTEITAGPPSAQNPPERDLEECLYGDCSEFLHFCLTKAYAGESVLFLRKVLEFKEHWDRLFDEATGDIGEARLEMYKAAVDIYMKLVIKGTPRQEINIPASIYRRLESLFKDAAALIASDRAPTSNRYSAIAPWDNPPTNASNEHVEQTEMMPLGTRRSFDEASTRQILDHEDTRLIGFPIPSGFGKYCFDAAEKSVKEMVRQGPWKDYCEQQQGQKK